MDLASQIDIAGIARAAIEGDPGPPGPAADPASETPSKAAEAAATAQQAAAAAAAALEDITLQMSEASDIYQKMIVVADTATDAVVKAQEAVMEAQNAVKLAQQAASAAADAAARANARVDGIEPLLKNIYSELQLKWHLQSRSGDPSAGSGSTDAATDAA